LENKKTPFLWKLHYPILTPRKLQMDFRAEESSSKCDEDGKQWVIGTYTDSFYAKKKRVRISKNVMEF
jgi:hypothetical protein